GDHGSDTESLHGGTRIRPHAIAEVSIREESAYPGSERRHVAGRDEITRPAILDQLLVAPHSGRDRGDAARHVLKQGVREPLGFGAEEATAEVFHDGDYVRQAPEQMQERAHAESLRQRLQVGLERAFPDQNEVRRWVIVMS